MEGKKRKRVLTICEITQFASALNSFREIKLSFVPFESKSSFIISKCSILSCVESPQPYSSCLIWITYLSCPLPPWPLPYSSIVSSPHHLVPFINHTQLNNTGLRSKINPSQILIHVKFLVFIIPTGDCPQTTFTLQMQWKSNQIVLCHIN